VPAITRELESLRNFWSISPRKRTLSLIRPHFTGQERDPESANDYFGARYYNQVAGRWLGVDPVRGRASSPQTLNAYSYALSDPINHVDVGGGFPWWIPPILIFPPYVIKVNVTQELPPTSPEGPSVSVPVFVLTDPALIRFFMDSLNGQQPQQRPKPVEVDPGPAPTFVGDMFNVVAPQGAEFQALRIKVALARLNNALNQLAGQSGCAGFMEQVINQFPTIHYDNTTPNAYPADTNGRDVFLYDRVGQFTYSSYGENAATLGQEFYHVLQNSAGLYPGVTGGNLLTGENPLQEYYAWAFEALIAPYLNLRPEELSNIDKNLREYAGKAGITNPAAAVDCGIH
jgi:RHS repeat-associated protein